MVDGSLLMYCLYAFPVSLTQQLSLVSDLGIIVVLFVIYLDTQVAIL